MPITKSGQTALSEINITPFVDVMLVLLIIFMVTAPFLQEGIDVDLPQAKTSSAPSESKDKVLTINREGAIYLSGDAQTVYTPETLAPKLSSLFGNAGDKTIYLRADKNVSYGMVVQIMSLCKIAGIDRIGMITEPEQKL